jgi:hypothetical protein
VGATTLTVPDLTENLILLVLALLSVYSTICLAFGAAEAAPPIVYLFTATTTIALVAILTAGLPLFVLFFSLFWDLFVFVCHFSPLFIFLLVIKLYFHYSA